MNQYFVVSITQGGTFDIVVQQSQPIVVSISSSNGGGGSVTSVGLQTNENGTDVGVSNTPITSAGNIVLSIPIADATKTGKLSNTDWSTFNGKQNALGFTPENVANKSTSVVTDQASDTKYPSVKAVYDWATSVFTTASAVASQIAAALVGYATEAWVQSQGYLTSVPTLQDVTDAGNTTTNTINVDSVAFDLTPTAAPGAGQIAYIGNTGALTYLMNSSNVPSSIGQTLHALVHNADSVTITKGQPVYLFGASGNKASVKLANNTSDATSAKTFGLAAENITSGQNGFVICQGVIEGLNTGSYTDGDILYLGATAGALTNVKPYAPNHLVYIGVVERANNGNGQIYVKVQNGYELDEIHNVDLVSVAPANNDILTYVTGSPNLWKPRSIATILGYTPANSSSTPKIILSDTGTYTLATSGVFTIMKAILIPANTFSSGVMFLDYLATRVSGTAGNISSRVYVGTSATVLGTQILANTSLSSTIFWNRANRAIAYKSATSTLAFNSTTLASNELGTNAAAATSTNIDWTVNQYIQIVLFNSAGDTSSIQWITLTHYA